MTKLWIHPGLIFIAGSFLIPLIKEQKRGGYYLLLLPTLALIDLIMMTQNIFISAGKTWVVEFWSYELVLGRIDRLSMVFGYAFVVASLCMFMYASYVRDNLQQVGACVYVGSTLGVVFAGDLLTLFFFSEMMALSALPLIWGRRTRESYNAGLRYILFHLFGGACLLAGILLHVMNTGSIAFEGFRFNWSLSASDISSHLVLIAFLINAAVPPLHAWLPDSYPEASVSGAVFLTAFTTKSAVYVLLRGFSGTEILIWLGAIMALYGVIFAVLENDIRRLLAYHIVSQVGYMVCGVGMAVASTAAGEMAANGVVAHAFCHILYKALLFMGAGAVLEVTGRSKLTELGGLYEKMPVTFHLYMIGAYSISGFPLFNGFISKTMIVYASGMAHLPVIWLMLEGASIGTFLHTGLKLPWGVWFAKNQPACEATEPPKNMIVAMGMTAFLCTLLGIYPKILYDMLPYPVRYKPYSIEHIVSMSQLLIFTLASFWLLRDKLHGEPTITLDTDWFYRKSGNIFIAFCNGPLIKVADQLNQKLLTLARFLVWASRNPYLAASIKRQEARMKIKKMVRDWKNYGLAERNLHEKLRRYPGELPKFGVGASILLILFLLFLSLSIYVL